MEKQMKGVILQLAFISSKENLENLESIRRGHLQNSGQFQVKMTIK